jgi:hypothetical protein
MQKMFVIHYYINKQILDSYLHTKSEKIWLLFTFVPYYDPLCRNIHRSMWQLLGVEQIQNGGRYHVTKV